MKSSYNLRETHAGCADVDSDTKQTALALETIEGPFTEQTWNFEAADPCWLLDYWKGLRGNRPCPAWSEVDLLAVYQYARSMTVKDSINGGEDFIVRFWGTELTRFLNFDATGKLLSEYYPKSDTAGIIESHRLALMGDSPVRRWGNSVFPDRGLASFETIHLPVVNDAGERAYVMSLTSFWWVESNNP